MPLTDITQPAAHITQSAAVLGGAGWAYMKYVRGRTFRHRAELALESTALEHDGDPALLVRATMRNEGLGRIAFRDPYQKILYVDALTEGAWVPGVTVGWEDEKPRTEVRLFRNHQWIEPGETIEEELLVPVPEAATATIAYQVRAWVRVPRRLRDKAQVWSANDVVPVGFEQTSKAEPPGDSAVNGRVSGAQAPRAR